MQNKEELKKLEEAISFYKQKIASQGMITNARDNEQLQRLVDLRKQLTE